MPKTPTAKQQFKAAQTYYKYFNFYFQKMLTIPVLF